MTEFQRMIRFVHVTTVPQSLSFFYGQVSYLKNRGFDVHAVSAPGEPARLFGERATIEVHTVPMARSITPIHDLVALSRLWWLFRRIKPDIVHSHTPKAGLLGTLAARAAGVKVVFLSVFGLPQMTMTGPVRRLLNLTTRFACLLADRVWCDSFSMRDYVVTTRLCARSKTVVFGHGSVGGVDAKRKFSPERYSLAARAAIRNKHRIPESALVLGFVGRIVRDKGIHELICAWHSLKEQYPDLHLLLVGQFEPKDPLLTDDVDQLYSDPRIHLIGHQVDVTPYFAVMDVYVMPSYREGFGVTNIEAAAMSLPVVSTRVPGCIDSVQDGITGTLVPPRDARALADAIREYLDQPELRSRHGEAGRERVLRDFRPEAIWEATYQEYMHILCEKKLPVSG